MFTRILKHLTKWDFSKCLVKLMRTAMLRYRTLYNVTNNIKCQYYAQMSLLQYKKQSLTLHWLNTCQLLTVIVQFCAIKSYNCTVLLFHTSPTAFERIWTIFSWGVATTLWLLISMMRWPTLTPPLSAIPPLMRLQIWNEKKTQTLYATSFNKPNMCDSFQTTQMRSHFPPQYP